MVEVITTDAFAEWYRELDEDDTKAIIRVVDLLAARGVSLPFPYSSEIKGSQLRLTGITGTIRRETLTDPLCIRSAAASRVTAGSG